MEEALKGAVLGGIIGAVLVFLEYTMLTKDAKERAEKLHRKPELDEAARLDGLSAPARVARIHLPLALPALATTVILVFIFCWNEFMLALTLMTSDAHKTVTAGIASVSGSSLYEIPWGPLSAAVVIATLPLILLVLAFERRIVSGLTRGAVKG